MQNFFHISSQQTTASAVISDCEQQLKDAPAAANFGFIYATDAMSADYKNLLNTCKTQTGIRHWIGSLGIGIISSGKEYYDTPAASIMLANFADTDFAMLPLIGHTDEIVSAIKTPREFITSLGILHGDPYNLETQNLLEALHRHVNNSFFVGGLTSSRSEQLQVADNVFGGGVSGVMFSENISILSNLSQGCSPVSDKCRISQAQGNVIFGIDNKPALDTLMEEMNIESQEQLQSHADDVLIGLCVPGSDINDYTARNLVGIDLEHKAFAINNHVNDGDEILFCQRNNQTAVDDMQRMLDSMAKRLHGVTPKGGIYISCVGRGREQFGNNSEEVKLIHEKLGNFPLTGFFANGEIHHNRLYGYTGVLTLFTQ